MFFKRQLLEIYNGGLMALYRKLFYIIGIPIVIIIRIISPFFVIRFGELISHRIGHFAGNTEIYLCENKAGINTPNKPFFDIFFLNDNLVCNSYMVKMWARVLNIWPSFIIKPIVKSNQILPGGGKHIITISQYDRDIHNILDNSLSSLKFTLGEELNGIEKLKSFGLKKDDKFVCLLVRDAAYLPELSYHSYRDCSIDNYILACEELTKRGYYVFRMGVKVANKISSSNPKIIDYATNGMRSEFMDIYLGAKCEFCVSTGSGWDCIPLIFRRPIVYTSILPIGYMETFRKLSLSITKHHIDIKSLEELSLSEIFARGVGFCMNSQDYEANDILLLENSPEEILDLIIEFDDRSKNIWKESETDILLQNKFWNIFPSNSLDNEKKNRLHGEIKAKFGSDFLRKNPTFIN
jgi:putative glycosyltransferase (TIGR04372 family)